MLGGDGGGGAYDYGMRGSQAVRPGRAKFCDAS